MKYKVDDMLHSLIMADMSDPVQSASINKFKDLVESQRASINNFKNLVASRRHPTAIVQNLETLHKQMLPSAGEEVQKAQALTEDELSILRHILILKSMESRKTSLTKEDFVQIHWSLYIIWDQCTPRGNSIDSLQNFTNSMLTLPDATPGQEIELLRKMLNNPYDIFSNPNADPSETLGTKVDELIATESGVSFESVKAKLISLGIDNRINVTPALLEQIEIKMARKVANTEITKEYRKTMEKGNPSAAIPESGTDTSPLIVSGRKNT